MAVPIQSQISNPITGVFGNGQMQIFSASGTWTVPPGVAKVRVRMWGAGGSAGNQASYYSGGGGGGFALKAIYELTGITSIPVTVGVGIINIQSGSTSTGFRAGTSSFGSYCSATGGLTGITSDNALGGVGVGGDINNTGGKGGWGGATSSGGGGGSASLIGGGGNAGASAPGNSSTGGAGAGWGSSTQNNPASGGFMTIGGIAGTTTTYYSVMPTASNQPFSIDFIGTGGGGGYYQYGVNGGGGGNTQHGGFPGGGSAYGSPSSVLSAGGLVIVEW